jgi:hypothetical protein
LRFLDSLTLARNDKRSRFGHLRFLDSLTLARNDKVPFVIVLQLPLPSPSDD